ncbi:MAG: class I SAM-dependent methyltransferase [Bacteroidota bacterium]
MRQQEAISLIEKGIKTTSGTWADIGAGTGVFTLALREMLTTGTIYAVDKSPHALWRLPLKGDVPIAVVEGDFNRPLDLPMLDGILMANALHYASDPVAVLKNLLSYLKPAGTFVLIEYETHRPLQPWIPYPVPFADFEKHAHAAGLSEPLEIGRAVSRYGHEHIYAAGCAKL